MVSRRMVIAGAGVTALALVGGAGVWRVTRRPQTALLPWALDGAVPSDVRLDAFRHAILAPNPHNRQPWVIALEGRDAAIISCDPARHLPQTDPFDRQITIGFGAFMELARIAAAQRGVRMEVAGFPDGERAETLDQRPVARMRFVSDARVRPDPLFAAITQRRTNRTMYDAARGVPPRLAQQLTDATVSSDAMLIAAARAITVAAITVETTTPRTHQETVDLIRIGAAEVDEMPDGISLLGPQLEALSVAGLLNRAALADPASTVFAQGLTMQRDICGSIPALLWVTTPDNSRASQLDAGRRYVRTQLRATQLGLAMHPLSQSLQEYGEMAALLSGIHRLLGAGNGDRVQMLARLGFAPAVPPAPRWPLMSHLNP